MLSVNMWNDCQNHGHVWLAIYNNNNLNCSSQNYEFAVWEGHALMYVHECSSNSINGFYHTIVKSAGPNHEAESMIQIGNFGPLCVYTGCF